MKEEAARGIVGFSSFLSEKVAEIKRDSVKRNRTKDVVVEKALFVEDLRMLFGRTPVRSPSFLDLRRSGTTSKHRAVV